MPQKHPTHPQPKTVASGSSSTRSPAQPYVALQRHFPDFEPLQVCEAVIPLYLIRIDLKVLERRELSLLAAYLLEAVALGLKYSYEWEHYLGVQERDLAPAAAELLTYGLVEQAVAADVMYRQLQLTLSGRALIAQKQKLLPVPKKQTCRLQYSALTGELCPVNEGVWPVERLLKEAVYVVPVADPSHPSL